MSIWLTGWLIGCAFGLKISRIFFVLGFLYSLRRDLFEADPNTRGGRTMLLLSIEALFELLSSFEEFFLWLSYLFPNEVLESLLDLNSGSCSHSMLSSTLYFDFGKIFENSFLSLGIFIVFKRFVVVLLFFKDNLIILDLGASNFSNSLINWLIFALLCLSLRQREITSYNSGEYLFEIFSYWHRWIFS